jgi:hypothetical protein
MKKILLLFTAGLFVISCTSNPDLEKSKESGDSANVDNTDSKAPSANSDTTAPSAASQSSPVNK